METINKLVGQVIVSVEGCVVGSESMLITTEGGDTFHWYHQESCCESVEIVQVDGDVSDLVGQVCAMAEETGENGPDTDDESYTWTFYKFASTKGYVPCVGMAVAVDTTPKTWCSNTTGREVW